jgi:hypothetical protein
MSGLRRLLTQKKPAAFLFLITVSLLSGCSDEPLSPEEEVRLYLKSFEIAVEERSLGQVKELIAEDYRDESGRVRREIVRIAAGYLLRNKSIHLLTQVDRIDILDEERARASLFVAMAGSPIASADYLLSLRADLHRFEVELERRDEGWRLTSARWRRAQAQDFH